jgi:hypothetical protein
MGAADVQGIGRAGDVGAQNADVQMRALDALSGAGELGSTMRRQYADETFARAGAEDAARRFDLDYVRDVHQRNADRRIRSKEAEAGVVTGIADQAAAQAAADQAAEDEQIMGLLSLAAMA